MSDFLLLAALDLFGAVALLAFFATGLHRRWWRMLATYRICGAFGVVGAVGLLGAAVRGHQHLDYLVAAALGMANLGLYFPMPIDALDGWRARRRERARADNLPSPRSRFRN